MKIFKQSGSDYKRCKKLIKKTTKKVTVKQKRIFSYGLDWEQISATCLKLSDYICKKCGGRARRAHHIIPLSKGGSNLQSNLMALCIACHKKQHRHMR